jgi:rod shape determining protein RodA
MLKQYKLKNYHIQLILYLSLLTLIGVAVIGSAEESVQLKQFMGFLLGFVLMIVISLFDYSFLLKFSWLYYIGAIVLLVLVRTSLGDSSNNSQRWINLAGIRFQPSELTKILFILFFSYFFSKYQEKINKLWVLALSFAVAAVPLYLIYKQPDTSTTIVTAFIFVVLLFIAGLSYKIIGAVLGISIPVAIVAVTYLLSHAEELIEKGYYQMKRVMAWREPTNPLYADKALQQQNSIMAIGSGQLWGKGLGNDAATSAKNTNFIIEPQTDFIFAVAGEELGFVGTATIIVLLFLIVIECILIGRKAKDLSGRLICCGMASLVGFQSFVNICVATGLMPNTGVTLPFVSYGLTSLVSLYIGMGFVLNVGLQPLKYTKGVSSL